jgi:hypothetical protein
MYRIRLTRELRERGFESSEIGRLARSGELRRLRRGAYGEPVTTALEPRLAHLELLEATLRQSSPDLVVSGMSAAAVHGLPLWRHLLDRVHLTRDRAGGRKERRYSQIRSIPLDPAEVVAVDGILVTSLARTVLDLGCGLGMRQAVVIGDAALRLGLTGAELNAALERGRGRHGIAQARRTIAFLDGRSESPGESMSRVAFLEVGLPAPELQIEVRNPGGVVIGRCDFDWEEFNTVGEFDGRVKYGRTLKPEQLVEDVVFDEKLREDAIRDEGKQMVRWIWPDLDEAEALKARILRAFARGRRTS